MRKAAGLKQWQLAEKIGTEQAMISQWETDRHIPNDRHMKAICDFFDVSTSFFVSQQAAQVEASALREAAAFRDIFSEHSGLRSLAIEEFKTLFGIDDDKLAERLQTNDAMNKVFDMVLSEDSIPGEEE